MVEERGGRRGCWVVVFLLLFVGFVVVVVVFFVCVCVCFLSSLGGSA